MNKFQNESQHLIFKIPNYPREDSIILKERYVLNNENNSSVKLPAGCWLFFREGIRGNKGSPLNFLVPKNVMGKVPIVGRNNRNFTHNVLRHQKI